jgi:2-hydroxycyclohexanecarboxyl-CoA dehydrogenase
MQRFEKARALVVGGGTMGAEIGRSLVAEGATVHFTYRSNEDGARTLASQLGAGCDGYSQLDIGDDDAVATTVAASAASLGGVDVLVVTAGYVHSMVPVLDVEFASVRKTIDVELVGLIRVATQVLPYMRQGGYGRMVFVGSDSGKVGSTGEAASSAARGGVIAFAKALARETAREHDICVNVICPGPTEGPLLEGQLTDPGITGKLTNAMMRAIPKRRAARTSEIAAATLFLASPDAGFVTGQALSVSGGLTMS